MTQVAIALAFSLEVLLIKRQNPSTTIAVIRSLSDASRVTLLQRRSIGFDALGSSVGSILLADCQLLHLESPSYSIAVSLRTTC